MDRLFQTYAAAKAENQRIWQVLQAEVRAGRTANELADLEARMWAAMRQLEKASEDLDDAISSSGKSPSPMRRRFDAA
jgi:hypothetical protein